MAILFAGSKNGNGSVSASTTSVAQQAVATVTRTVLSGTAVQIPAPGLVVGAKYTASFSMTKTAAGTATSVFDVATVPNGSTPVVANATARVSFTKPAGTAAIDEGLVSIVVVTRTVAAAGILVGTFALTHIGNTAGHATVPSVNLYSTSAGFDNTALAGGYLLVAVTAGASDALAFETASADLYLPLV